MLLRCRRRCLDDQVTWPMAKSLQQSRPSRMSQKGHDATVNGSAPEVIERAAGERRGNRMGGAIGLPGIHERACMVLRGGPAHSGVCDRLLGYLLLVRRRHVFWTDHEIVR
jgi:hypothetical protein